MRGYPRMATDDDHHDAIHSYLTSPLSDDEEKLSSVIADAMEMVEQQTTIENDMETMIVIGQCNGRFMDEWDMHRDDDKAAETLAGWILEALASMSDSD